MNYEQAFAVVGLGTFQEVDVGRGLEAITVGKVVWTREVAESEASRLNRTTEGKGAVYFWTSTRVEQR
jgi:hypothetical protein